jgi:hypothetical protein
MSTRSCIKFGIVIFVPLLVSTGSGVVSAQINPNTQTQVEQMAPSMGPQTPVFTEQARPRNLHGTPSKHRVRHPKQSR